MYLIAKIRGAAQPWNEEICSFLKPPIRVFLPHKHNPYNLAPAKIPKRIHDLDVEQILASDAGLLLPPYGEDCAYEVGVYKGLRLAGDRHRPVIAFTRGETRWLRDWMVKGNVQCVVTDDPGTAEALRRDDLACHCSVALVQSPEALNGIIASLVEVRRTVLHP